MWSVSQMCAFTVIISYRGSCKFRGTVHDARDADFVGSKYNDVKKKHDI